MLVLTLTNDSGTHDITSLQRSITLSGDYRQCARTLTLELLVSATDKNIPVIKCPLGGGVTLSENNKLLFAGYAFTKEKSTDSTTMTVTCFDRGIYLKNNRATYKFTGQTPEEIARRVCLDFKIPVGTFAKTGIAIKRKFDNVSLYQIIETAYTLASQKNGKRYMIRFRGGYLDVIEKVQKTTGKIAGGLNLMTANYSESIESMINRVKIEDKNGKTVRTLSNDNAVKLYGLMQSIIRQSDGEDASKEAKKVLEDNDVERKVSVDSLGDASFITGNTVVLHDSFTGLNGVFWIDSDTHSWKNGVYTNKLTLNFRNMMDEQQAGTEEKKNVKRR